MLESVVNLSEGRDGKLLSELAKASPGLLDVHADPWHNRSVLTLVANDVVEAALAVAKTAVALLDLRAHEGVHPRLGVIDVVPFVPLGRAGYGGPIDLGEAVAARDRFATLAADELGLPCFLYGPERSLPEVRRRAFVDLGPDSGPAAPHPTAGACCVGARPCLVAYNLYLASQDLAAARRIARELRCDEVRALGVAVGDEVQVSCNLIAPWLTGPAQIYDEVQSRAEISRAELVGLVPEALLATIPPSRWAQLDLGPDRTVEARLARLN